MVKTVVKRDFGKVSRLCEYVARLRVKPAMTGFSGVLDCFTAVRNDGY